MSKRILIGLVTFLTGFGLLCAAGISEKNNQKTEKPVEVKIWVRTSGTDPGYEAIIKKFNDENPDVRVSYEFYGENYPSVIQMALASGNGPDIIEANTGVTVAGLARQGQIVPLDDILTPEMLQGLHPDAAKAEENRFNGKTYAVPVRITTYRLYYNRDLFEKAGLDPNKPPKTFAELREMSKKITLAGKGEFYGFGLPLGVAQIWERVMDPILVAEDSCGRYGYNNKNGKYEFESSKDLFMSYVHMMKDGSLFPGYLTMGIDPLRGSFAQGKVGMYIDGNWMVGQFPVQMKAAANYDIAPLPVSNGKTAGKYWAEGGVPWTIAKGKNEAAAKRFYKYWLRYQNLANQFMPVPRTFLAANEKANLPLDTFNIKGFETGFRTNDLQIPVFEPHKFLVLQGDDRNRVLTNLFAKASDGKDITEDLNVVFTDLNKRYTAALEKAVADKVIIPELLKK